jgi:putative ABC transport system ATP-binding protein
MPATPATSATRDEDALIALDDVTKTYASGETQVRALRGVSLRVDAGEFVAIMGSSGSGKSTMMNVLGCLDRPSTGVYRLAGVEVQTLDKVQLAYIRNRTLGFVFQSFNLLARTSALENVELPLLYAGLPTRDRRRLSREALERVGLADRVGHLPNQLSGGQQQRVAIARAIVSKPKVLLADEPTGALDSTTSMEIMALFQGLSREGITIVLVTHEPDIAQCASRLVVMKDGAIKKDETQRPIDARGQVLGEVRT